MSLRIISGERRGAKLKTPDGFETRPLRDRVRGSLFNILRQRIEGAAVLDAFAGSGAAGLEALSNGAAHATFVESSPKAAAIIAENIEKLRYEDRALLIRGETPLAVARSRAIPAPFSLLFLMPPYHSGLCQKALAKGGLTGRCAEAALAVCEIHEDEEFETPEGWQVEDDRKYGITRLVFLIRN